MTEKQNKIFRIVIVALVFAFTIFITQFQKKLQEDKNLVITLKQYANEGNDYCPFSVGSSGILIVQKVYYREKKTVVFEHRFLTHSKDSFDLESMKESFLPITIEELESIKSLEVLRNKNIIFEYQYFDNQNNEMFTIRALFNTPIILE